MIEELKEKISDAELVLVGIGEEFEIRREEMTGNKTYARAFADCENKKDYIPFIEKHFYEECRDGAVLKRKESYCKLAELLKGKNYFVITLCMDGLIRGTGLKQDRVAEPCGNYRKMQCCEKCTTDLYCRDEEAAALTAAIFSGFQKEADPAVPICPVCGRKLVFNNILADHYAEEGYQEEWQLYRKWLQGTVNRKVCVLELGAGMRFPTVIRWPFEKVVYFNRKAFMYRVHSRLYQVTQKIKERSLGVEASPLEFLKRLSNEA